MAFSDVVAAAQVDFPDLQVKYKDESTLMKVLSGLMFFNPQFMTNYATTFGDTVYFPSRAWLAANPYTANLVFIHECTHMYDEKRVGFWYSLAYAFPQLLSPVMLLLLFFLSWKIVVPLVVLFLLPLPAPWRAYFEKRAYFVQLYAGFKMRQENLATAAVDYAGWFRTEDYYWMWPFEQNQDFTQEVTNIQAGRPDCASEPALLQQVDTLIAAALK